MFGKVDTSTEVNQTMFATISNMNPKLIQSSVSDIPKKNKTFYR
jgi:hypothetical protein